MEAEINFSLIFSLYKAITIFCLNATKPLSLPGAGGHITGLTPSKFSEHDASVLQQPSFIMLLHLIVL